MIIEKNIFVFGISERNQFIFVCKFALGYIRPSRGRSRKNTPCTPSLAMWQAQQRIAGQEKSVF
jgi:hypothetical protein